MCPAVETVQAVGGPAAVSEDALADAVAAAEHCHGEDGGTNQTYRVDPQEVRTDAPGREFQFSVDERYDDRALTAGQDVALFPCSAVTATERVVRFDDADGDGHADGIATTKTNSAVFGPVGAVRGLATATRSACSTAGWCSRSPATRRTAPWRWSSETSATTISSTWTARAAPSSTSVSGRWSGSANA